MHSKLEKSEGNMFWKITKCRNSKVRIVKSYFFLLLFAYFMKTVQCSKNEYNEHCSWTTCSWVCLSFQQKHREQTDYQQVNLQKHWLKVGQFLKDASFKSPATESICNLQLLISSNNKEHCCCMFVLCSRSVY